MPLTPVTTARTNAQVALTNLQTVIAADPDDPTRASLVDAVGNAFADQAKAVRDVRKVTAEETIASTAYYENHSKLDPTIIAGYQAALMNGSQLGG